MAENPYSPPAKDGAYRTPAEDGISFSDFDLERVSRATSWMRRVASIQFGIGILVLLLTALFALLARRQLEHLPILIAIATAGVYALILIFGGVWLRQSCVAFYDGIMQNAESGLALGFRKLRLYFVLYGVLGLVGLAATVLKLIGGGL